MAGEYSVSHQHSPPVSELLRVEAIAHYSVLVHLPDRRSRHTHQTRREYDKVNKRIYRYSGRRLYIYMYTGRGSLSIITPANESLAVARPSITVCSLSCESQFRIVGNCFIRESPSTGLPKPETVSEAAFQARLSRLRGNVPNRSGSRTLRNASFHSSLPVFRSLFFSNISFCSRLARRRVRPGFSCRICVPFRFGYLSAHVRIAEWRPVSDRPSNGSGGAQIH